MTTYAVAEGHDVALIDLDTIDPQPKCPGIRPTLRSHSAAGTVHDQGNYAELIFNMLESVAQYQAVLALFGLDDAVTSEVTVILRDATFADGRYNGTAVRPVIDDGLAWNEYLPRDIVILIKNVEAVAE